MIIVGLMLSISPLNAQDMTENEKNLIAFLKKYTAKKYPNRDFSKPFLYVSIQSQCMYWIQDWSIEEAYTISAAAHGAGNIKNSNQTPVGLHTVKEKFGDDVPWGGIMKSRRYIGRVAKVYTDRTDVKEDYVTTRILRLTGEEPGINKGGNVDSYERYIYIHGTPEEGLLGNPASHGCIRMRNAEVIELYNKTPKGTMVLMLDQ